MELFRHAGLQVKNSRDGGNEETAASTAAKVRAGIKPVIAS
jgi:hypothetical protein